MSVSTVSLEEWKYWYNKVYGYFYKRLNGEYEIEELTAQTLNTAFLAKDIKNFKAYLWKVAHNYLVRYIQTKNLEPFVIGFDDNFDIGSDGETKFEVEETIENLVSVNYKKTVSRMLQCIHNFLNPLDKQILELAIYEEKNSTQIATVVGLNSGNVRQRLSRVIKKLRSKCLALWQTLTQK
jgi:RNA polymerase sigma factor (sigma-70 family)